MRNRLTLIMAVAGGLVDIALIVAIVMLVLPAFGIELSSMWLAFLLVGWGAWSAFTFWLGQRALNRKPLAGLPGMTGATGEVVRPLAPKGAIRVCGELWEAVAESGTIEAGEKVAVIAQKGLKLTVRKAPPDLDC